MLLVLPEMFSHIALEGVAKEEHQELDFLDVVIFSDMLTLGYRWKTRKNQQFISELQQTSTRFISSLSGDL